MLDIIKIIILSLTSLVCAMVAGYLVIHSIEGWGWFLFAAIITLDTPSFQIFTKEKTGND